jgi:hypothetical protein
MLVATKQYKWVRNKNSISLSIAKAIYIAAKRLCTQLFWMKKVLEDYSLSKVLVQHKKKKHIDSLKTWLNQRWIVRRCEHWTSIDWLIHEIFRWSKISIS